MTSGTIPMPDSTSGDGPSFEEALRVLQELAAPALASAEQHPAAPERADGPGVSFSNLQYRHLVEQIPAVVFTAKLDGGFHDVYVSPQIEALLGYSQQEWVRDPVLWYERLHPDDRMLLNEEFARGCVEGRGMRAECRFFARDGSIIWIHGEARIVRASGGAPLFLQGVAFDVTDIKRAEERVRASLREKETLLQEIHHRVKNNLQITVSLLRLQESRGVDEASLAALREAQSRIRSIALVHEHLYRADDLSRIDIGDYLRELTRQVVRAYASGASVRTEVDATEAGSVGIQTAVPCGLIVNELVSNALKHAFPDERGGSVTVRFRTTDEAHELTVADDGVGLPSDLDAPSGGTLGLQLVSTLTQQVGGRLTMRSAAGAQFRIEIPRQGHDA